MMRNVYSKSFSDMTADKLYESDFDIQDALFEIQELTFSGAVRDTASPYVSTEHSDFRLRIEIDGKNLFQPEFAEGKLLRNGDSFNLKLPRAIPLKISTKIKIQAVMRGIPAGKTGEVSVGFIGSPVTD